MSLAVVTRESANMPAVRLVKQPAGLTAVSRFKSVDVKAIVAEVAEMPVETAGLSADVMAMLKNPPADFGDLI